MTDNDNTIEAEEKDKDKAPESPATSTVVGIRFRSCGKIYTFEVDDIEISPGSRVVVDSEMGLSIGNVVTSKKIIEKTREPLKKVLRVANDKDYETVKSNRDLENEARQFCVEKAKSLNLPMKIVSTETTMDKKRFIFYFTADGRIDFRELVRDLASKFKTRIEMRQIGVRDEVKLLGGFGCCGRQTCCSLFLTSFAPITIRMAKEQALSINQSKLSGVCGRLMCCLGYEKRDPSARKAASRKEPLVTVTDEDSDSGFQTLDPVSIEEDAKAGQSGQKQKVVAVPEKRKETQRPPKEGTSSEKGEQAKRRFKKDRGRRHKTRAPQTSPEGTPDRQQQGAPAPDKSGQPETQGKGRPFNKRRKFWKKKKQ